MDNYPKMEEKTIWEIDNTSEWRRIIAGFFIGTALFLPLFYFFNKVLLSGEWENLVLIAIITPGSLLMIFIGRWILLPEFHIKFSEKHLYIRKILFKKVFNLYKIEKIEINLVKRSEYKRTSWENKRGFYWVNDLKFTLEINTLFKKPKTYSFKAEFSASERIYGQLSAAKEISNDMLFHFKNDLKELPNIYPNLVVVKDSTPSNDYQMGPYMKKKKAIDDELIKDWHKLIETFPELMPHERVEKIALELGIDGIDVAKYGKDFTDELVREEAKKDLTFFLKKREKRRKRRKRKILKTSNFEKN